MPALQVMISRRIDLTRYYISFSQVQLGNSYAQGRFLHDQHDSYSSPTEFYL